MPASKVDAAFDELMSFVPVPWSIEEFVNRFAAHRDRPIALEVRPLPPLVHGLLVVQASQDVIIYDVLDSDERSELQILHEVGHLAMDHSLIGEPVNDLAAGLTDSCPYPLGQQAEADLLAAMLITAVRSQPQYQVPTELGRLTSTLL